MEDEVTRAVLKTTRDGTSSLFANDDPSVMPDRNSTLTENTANLSREFAFDVELTNCRVYRRALKSNMRRAICLPQPALPLRQTVTGDEPGSPQPEQGLTQKVSRGTVTSQNDIFGSPDQKIAESDESKPPKSEEDGSDTTHSRTLDRSQRSEKSDGNKLVARTEMQDRHRAPQATQHNIVRHELNSTHNFARRSKFAPAVMKDAMTTRRQTIRSKGLSNDAYTSQRSQIKVLLAGTTGSGKTTLLQSMRLQWEGFAFLTTQRLEWAVIIRRNIAQAALLLASANEHQARNCPPEVYKNLVELVRYDRFAFTFGKRDWSPDPISHPNVVRMLCEIWSHSWTWQYFEDNRCNCRQRGQVSQAQNIVSIASLRRIRSIEF